MPISERASFTSSSLNGLIIDLIDGKKPNSENLCELILKTIDNKDLKNEKIRNATILLREKFDENKNFEQYLEVFQ